LVAHGQNPTSHEKAWGVGEWHVTVMSVAPQCTATYRPLLTTQLSPGVFRHTFAA
jgi:hypothetical protein